MKLGETWPVIIRLFSHRRYQYWSPTIAANHSTPILAHRDDGEVIGQQISNRYVPFQQGRPQLVKINTVCEGGYPPLKVSDRVSVVISVPSARN